ncbi:MAG: hypothetical protein ACTHU0_14320 [Kofleriaceae bacterium]
MQFGTLACGAALFAAISLSATTARADGPPGDLPKWCAGIDGRMESSASFIEDEAKNTGYGTDRVARTIARGACGWRTTAEGTQKIRERVAAGRAKFMAATGFSNAETDELFSIVFDQKRTTAESDAFCKAIRVDEDAAPHEVSKSKALRYLVCDRGYGGGDYDWTDLTEIERVAQVHGCLRSVSSNFNRDTDTFAQQPWTMLQFATCNVLATHLDPKKFAAEVAADPRFNRYAALWAKAALTETQQLIGVAQERYKKIGAKQPYFEELLFTAPAKGYSAFMALYNDNKAVMDQATVLFAGARKVKQLAKHAGCAATFEPLLVKAMAEKHPTNLEGVKLAFRDTFIHYMGLAFATCEAIDGHDLVASIYGGRLSSEPSPGTPMEAVRAAVLEVMFANADDIKGVRDMTVQRPAPISGPVTSPPRTSEAQGVIASVAPKGDMIAVTFKKETWVEQLYNCKETNKIDRIDDRGKIVYRQVCTEAGTKKHELKEAPVVVEKRFAGALKAGRFLEMRVTEGERIAVPIAVYAAKDKKQLVGYLGFVL